MTNEEVAELARPLRTETFRAAVDLCRERNLSVFVETGCFRGEQGDGMSTTILGRLAKDLGTHCFSIDINPEHIARAHEIVASLPVILCESDSVAWLSRFQGQIGLLYLDSLDYEVGDPLSAQLHQLAELGAAYGKLTPQSVILIDDCNLEGGGKGLLTTDFLKRRGWRIAREAYQRVFVK